MKKLILIIFTLMVAGCAAYRGFNQISHGTVVFRGGIYQDRNWDDTLEFKRISWYHGMTLYYDALIYKADPKSPFARWFSLDERQYFNKCDYLLITVNYSADPSKLSHVQLREQMRLNGFDDVVTNQFASYLKTHPSYQAWNLQNYKILGYCKRSPSRVSKDGNLHINFPSFEEVIFKL